MRAPLLRLRPDEISRIGQASTRKDKVIRTAFAARTSMNEGKPADAFALRAETWRALA